MANPDQAEYLHLVGCSPIAHAARDEVHFSPDNLPDFVESLLEQKLMPWQRDILTRLEQSKFNFGFFRSNGKTELQTRIAQDYIDTIKAKAAAARNVYGDLAAKPCLTHWQWTPEQIADAGPPSNWVDEQLQANINWPATVLSSDDMQFFDIHPIDADSVARSFTSIPAELLNHPRVAPVLEPGSEAQESSGDLPQ